MTVFLAGLGILAAGGIVSCLLRRRNGLSAAVGVVTAVAGSVAAACPAAAVLCTGASPTLTAAWPVPMGSFAVELDTLSALFLCAVFGLSILAAVYGWAYLGKPAASAPDRGAVWLWFNLLVVAMAVVVTARNAVLFLMAWEVMSVASFFLVAFESDRDQVRHAAWTYLVATHLGSALLLAMFVAIGAATGSLDYAAWGSLKGAAPGFLNTLFVLGLVGFGVKAGLYPVHVWLPEAHPAAPSHVSALMSGVMIKTGLYALIRLCSLLGAPRPWHGWLMLGIGVASGIMGVVFALAQHDIKRLLAYHSVENIGIIAMGLGLGLLGWSYGLPLVMAAGFAGGLLHVLNHAVFKGLLFLSAGAVVHATGCRDLERMGGLMRRMPVTGASFLTGSAAICGLPPLNGFVSEFLIYVAAFTAAMKGPTGGAIPAIAVVVALALIGGLAAACFAKVFGIAFLGEPRSEAAAGAHECGRAMYGPQLVLAGACFAIVWIAPLLAPALFRAAAVIAGQPPEALADQALSLHGALSRISAGAAVLVAAYLLLALLRRALLRGRRVARGVTWDCGFAEPTARMQYTAASFAQPITSLFRGVLGLRIKARLPSGLFPGASSFETHAGDTANEYLFRPAFRFTDRALARLRWVQAGPVQIYVLYVAVTLLILLLAAL